MLKRFYIEITNICNLQCAFCLPTSRPSRFMSPDFFHGIVRQVRNFTPYIYLHVQGEPLGHPQLEEILNICDEEEMQVQLVTNGTLLSRYPDLLHHSSLRRISFSLQSVEYQHNASMQEYMAPILKLIEQASAAGHPYCELRFWRTDQIDMPRTAECFSILKDRYVFEPTGRKSSCRILPGVYVSSDNMFDWPSSNQEQGDMHGTCHGALDQLAVLSDGTVVPCCLDNNANVALGNLTEHSLEEILSSPKMKNITEGFRNYEVREEFCRKCTFRHRFDRKESKHQ